MLITPAGGGGSVAAVPDNHDETNVASTSGMKVLLGPEGKNDFRIRIGGPNPNLAVGGSHDQQEQQRDDTLKLELEAGALKSYATGHLPLGRREPSDCSVANTLKGLNPNPPDGGGVTHAIYTSHIPNATPEEAYRHFVQDPQAVFGAGGMEIRPPPGDAGLKDGGKYMLESGGPPPIWLPIQLGLNPSKNQITIHTLDGHPLRGVQTFTFTSDGHGGTELKQDARFQASSSLIGAAQHISSVSNGQHEAWQYAHQEIYQYFNGNPDYKGLGTNPLSSGHLRDDLNVAIHAVTHPGDTYEGAIDTVGALINAADHEEGRLLGGAMDALHIPGSGVVKNVIGEIGDIQEKAYDTAGSVVKDAIDNLNPANWF